MTRTPSGIFTPIEDVIAEAEARAEAEYDREHQPCPHDVVLKILCGDSWCADCGQPNPGQP